MFAYIDNDISSISEKKDDIHYNKVDISIGEFNYILNSDIASIKGLIEEIIKNTSN